MAKKKQSKWVLKNRELELVGIQHRVTLSTRRFMQARVDEKKMGVEFKREPDNAHDPNAIAVYAGSDPDNPYKNMRLGYIPRKVAEVLAPAMDEGKMEFGPSFLTGIDVDKGVGDLQVKMRVRRGVKIHA